MAHFCLIRRFKEEDQQPVRDIITEVTMEQAGNFFWGAILSETLLQIVVIFFAASFIIVGIPFKFCFAVIPITIALFYVLIWFGHWTKATELNGDLNNMRANYVEDTGTSFFVAEMYGKSGEAELAHLMNKVKKVEYDFYNAKEFEAKDVNRCGLSKTVVGTVAITRSMNHSKRAWIRRMAVKKEYRRRCIASHLLTEAIAFCEDDKDYDGIELITTECHMEARQMYLNEGFKQVESSRKSFLGPLGSQARFHLYRPCGKKAPREAGEGADEGHVA